MNKKIISIIALILIIGIIAIIVGMKINIRTENLTREEAKYILSVDVPKNKKYKIVDKIENRKKYAPYSSDYILVGNKVEIYFSHESFVYQTGNDFKNKFPNLDKENPNFNDYIKVTHPDNEKFYLNNRAAIREEFKDENEELKGYYYYLDISEDVFGYLNLLILPANENGDIKDLIKDPEVKVILDSIKVTPKE